MDPVKLLALIGDPVCCGAPPLQRGAHLESIDSRVYVGTVAAGNECVVVRIALTGDEKSMRIVAASTRPDTPWRAFQVAEKVAKTAVSPAHQGLPSELKVLHNAATTKDDGLVAGLARLQAECFKRRVFLSAGDPHVLDALARCDPGCIGAALATYQY